MTNRFQPFKSIRGDTIKAEDLRASILQAAVQGKLVPQDPNDEPAEELVKRIRAEKQRLIREGKIKKERNVSEIHRRDGHWYETIDGKDERCIDDEIPFEIPDTWTWCRLSVLIGKIGSGKTPSGGKNVYKKSGVMFIRSQNVYNDGLRLNEVAYIDEATNNSMLGTIVKPLDILLNITGASIGRCSVVPENFTIANVNQHVMIIRLIDKKLVQFVHKVLVSPFIFSSIMSLQVGATKEGLSASSAKNLLIMIPPLNEQNKIVEKIDSLIPLIERYGQIESEYSSLIESIPGDLRASILQAAVQGRLVPQNPNDEPAEELVKRIRAEKQRLIREGKIKKERNVSEIHRRDGHWYETIDGKDERCIDDEINYAIPSNWTVSRLSSLIELVSGSDLKSNQYNESKIGMIYLTGASNIDGEDIIINRWTTNPKNIAYRGDILLTCKGTIGKTCILKEDSVHIARQFMSIRPIGMNIEFVQFYLNNVNSVLNDLSKGTIPGIEREDVLNLIIAVPPCGEQNRIVNEFKKLIITINSYDLKLSD